jgi:DNA-binding NtrC family response regulator
VGTRSDQGDTPAPESLDGDTLGGTTIGTEQDHSSPPSVRQLRLSVVEGPDKRTEWQSDSDRGSVGSHESNDFVIHDPTASRFHCEIRVDERGRARIRDLDSRNGTQVDGVAIVEGFLRGGSLIRTGNTVLRFQFGAEQNQLPVSSRSSFGSLIGKSPAMRTTFALLERAAATAATVLIEGETGTGKEGAAAAIHQASDRASGPFIVIDCSAIPESLIESELFGHEKGSFTGAGGRRVGAFEEASGGTIFLDELGELPTELQPKLLRVLEQRQVRRIGSNVGVPIDVRVIAATNRDLRAEVNAGRFRSDLYYRLAVVKVLLPSLRSRPEDIPVLAERILKSLGAEMQTEALLTPSFVASLCRFAWPGNVRELRNYLERCLVFQEAVPIGEPPASEAPLGIDVAVPYVEARRRLLNRFEREYTIELLKAHDGKVAAAANAAEVDRVYIYRLMKRHGIKT